MPTLPVYMKNWCYQLLLKDAEKNGLKPAAVIQKIVEAHYAQKRVRAT